MTKIILDPTLRVKLPDMSKPFAVCDESGNLLGRFIPTALDPPLTREEVERRKQNKGKIYSTAEVLAHLEKL